MAETSAAAGLRPASTLWQFGALILIPPMGGLTAFAWFRQGADATTIGVSSVLAALITLFVARHMLTLLENRRLYERLSAAFTVQGEGLAQRVAELEWLRDASRQITAARTLADVVEVAFDAVKVGFGFDRVGINLF